MNKKQKKRIPPDKSFWDKLVADGETNTVSSKRLSMLICLIMLIILSLLSAFGYNCSEAFIYIFGSLVGAQSGLTTIEKCKKSVTRLTDSKKHRHYSDDDYLNGDDEGYFGSSASEDDLESEDEEN